MKRVGRLGLAVGVLLAIGAVVAACAPSTQERPWGDAFPPGSCVVIVGDTSVDQDVSVTRVSCDAHHTDVVVSVPANGERCPLGLENRVGLCVRSALPSPSPYPGGVTAP